MHCKSDSGRDKLNARLDEQLFHLGRVLQETPPGTTVRVVSPEGNIFYGVVSRITQKGQNGSPAAPNNWKLQVLIDHRSRQLIIPLAKFNRGKDDAATQVSPQDRNWEGEDIYQAFDIRQTQSQRTEMQIFTGNPIKAYEKFPKGKFVNYTNDQGEVMQGLVMPASFDIQEALREEVVALHEPHQVKAFLTEITQYRASVKTLDELLTIKTQTAARFGNDNATGFVLQTVKSSAGDRYSLDSDIINAAGAEFYSVSDRMECIVPEDRIDEVLRVILEEKRWALAAFDFKDQARDFLGVELPEFQKVESPVEPAISSDPPHLGTIATRVLPANEQSGIAEQNVANFLEQAGLATTLMADPEFYLTVPNEPYISLTIERHEVDFHLIHWLKDSAGDLFIDAEMVFQLSTTGHLTLYETAVQNALTGGELRGHDPSFAQLFSRNLLQQGFAQAVQQMQVAPEQQESEKPVAASPQTKPILKQKSWEWQQVDRSDLTATALTYLQLKDQHPNALVLQRSPSGDFYQALFSDAQTISNVIDLVVIHKDLGDAARHAPTLLIPTSPGVMQRITEYLQAQGFNVVVDEGIHQTIIHEPPATLFDVEQFTTSKVDYQVDVQGHDPTWQPVANSPTQTDIKTLADRVREFDLEGVAEQLGLERDRHDKHKWRGLGHIISITNGRFNDWTMGKGGGGAIDLVMHVQNVDFKAAVQWLSGQSLAPVERSSQPLQPLESRQFELPPADANNWATVRQYLTETRGLPAAWVDGLHQQGLIYADAHRNAVFLRHAETKDGQVWSRGHPTGASLRGTDAEQTFHGLATGSVREDGWFWVRLGKEAVQRVVLVESAIDALSLAVLEREKSAQPIPTVYLSTDGSGAIPTATLKAMIANGGQVIVAFDADKAGEKLAWRVAEVVPGVQRMVPAVGKDWNERLVAKQHPERGQPATLERGNKPTLQTLWKWHRVARDEGKSDQYLSRITEVARDVVDGKSLPDKAVSAMQQDLQRHQQQKKETEQGAEKLTPAPVVLRKPCQGFESGG